MVKDISYVSCIHRWLHKTSNKGCPSDAWLHPQRPNMGATWRFPIHGGTPKSFKSLDSFSIETYGDLEIHDFEKPP